MDACESSYWLVATDGTRKQVRLPDNAALLVGRGEHNHLVLDDYRVSRQHSRVALERDGYVVYDLNSSNGTFVNGEAIRRHALKVDDEVSFGPFVFRLERHEEVASDKAQGGAKRKGGTWRPVESVTQMFDRNTVARSLAFRATLPTIDLNHLQDAHRNLGILYAFVQEISKTIDKRELLNLVGGEVLEIFPAAASVSIHLFSDAEQDGFALASLMGDASSLAPFTVVESDAAVRAGRAIFGPRGEAPGAFARAMYAPMVDRGVTLGIIAVNADARMDGFSPADLELFNAMAAPATIMLQNTRMHEESLARERLRADLELAAEIQRSFLPRETLSVEGVEFLATYRAAYTVGGDFYDMFWVGPTRLAVFIGDIAGKGIAAALLMTRISAELRVAALAHVEPVSVFATMNKALIGRNQPDLFFTAIYFTLDIDTGEVILANAGHTTPFVCHADGSLRALDDGTATAVGIFDDTSFASTTFTLEDGDSLVLYTDGVIEAADQAGHLYGEARLVAALQGVGGSRPQDVSRTILRGVADFTQRAQATDDLTIVICHRSLRARASIPVHEDLRPTAAPPPPPAPAPDDEAVPITMRW